MLGLGALSGLQLLCLALVSSSQLTGAERKYWLALGQRRKRGVARALVLPRGTMLVEGVGAAWPALCSAALPVCGVVVRALSAWRVRRCVTVCRDVSGNNIAGRLPAQYSALTSLQDLCVAPDPKMRWSSHS